MDWQAFKERFIERAARCYGGNDYLTDEDEERLVMPPRPRLRIERVAPGRAPVVLLDLLPALDSTGAPIKDTWLLPQRRTAFNKFESETVTTDWVRKRMEKRQARVRVLDL